MKQPFWNNIVQPSAIKFAMTNFVPGTSNFGNIVSISETGEYVAITCIQTSGDTYAKGAIAIYNTFSRSQVGYYLYPGTEQFPNFYRMSISGNGLRTIGGIFGYIFGSTRRVIIINNTDASLYWQFDVPQFIDQVYLSPDSNLAAVKYEFGRKLRTYDVSTKTMIREFDFSGGSCFFSSSGSYVVGRIGLADYTLYNPYTGAILGTFPEPSNAGDFPVISLDNTLYGCFVRPSGISKAQVYKMSDNTLLAEKTLEANSQNVLAWSGDLKSIISPLVNDSTSYGFSSVFNSAPFVKISESDTGFYARFSISANGTSFVEGIPSYNSNQGIVYLY